MGWIGKPPLICSNECFIYFTGLSSGLLCEFCSQVLFSSVTKKRQAFVAAGVTQNI